MNVNQKHPLKKMMMMKVQNDDEGTKDTELPVIISDSSKPQGELDNLTYH